MTYGPTYAFSLGCQNEGCRARFEWELDLTELPVRPLTDESRAAFTDGNRFEPTLPDAGVRVWFRLFTGADERKLPQLCRNAGERILSAMLGWRFDLWSMLPKHNRREDQTGDLLRFIACLQEVTELLLAEVDRFPEVFDIERAPEVLVDLILAELGNPFPSTSTSWGSADSAPSSSRCTGRRGTVRGIISAVRFFLGVEIQA